MRQLRELDRESTFRFLDLLPELRKLIYVDVLKPMSSRRLRSRVDRHPEILRTCKGVYKEAERVLYCKPVFSIDIECALVNPDYFDQRSRAYVCVRGDAMPLYESAQKFVLGSCPVIFPACLHQIRHLEIRLTIMKHKYKRRPQPESLAKANHVIYKLASKVMEARCLKTLSVELSLVQILEDMNGLCDALFPLALLAALCERGVKVAFSGITADIEAQLCRYTSLSIRADSLGRSLQQRYEATIILQRCSPSQPYISTYIKLSWMVSDAEKQGKSAWLRFCGRNRQHLRPF